MEHVEEVLDMHGNGWQLICVDVITDRVSEILGARVRFENMNNSQGLDSVSRGNAQ